MGNAYANLGDVPKAIEYYQQGLKIAQEIGDKRAEGADLGNLGNAYANLGDVPKAIEYYQQSLRLGLEIGDRDGTGRRLLGLWNLIVQTRSKPGTIWIPGLLIVARQILDGYGVAQAVDELLAPLLNADIPEDARKASVDLVQRYLQDLMQPPPDWQSPILALFADPRTRRT